MDRQSRLAQRLRHLQNERRQVRHILYSCAGLSHCENETRVVALDFGQFGNGLDGTIPLSIGNLEALGHLDLSNNHQFGNGLTGSIPDSVGRLKVLEHLDLGSNRLNGSIPDSIGQLKKLEYLNLSDKFTSWTDHDFCNQA